MNKAILLAAAAAALLTTSACNRQDGGAEKESNKAEETANGSSGAREPSGSDERSDTGNASRNEEVTDVNTGDASTASSDDDAFGSRLRGAGGRSGSGEEAELRDALRRAAAEQQARLPLRDGVTTVYDVEARGTEFVVSLRIAQDFNDEQFERLEQAFHRNSCTGDSAELIRLGATTTYRVTDSEGERRSYSFDSCPA